jgi:hypothetical protein
MKNLLLLLTLVVAGTLCYAVYAVKYEVESLEAKKAQLTQTLLQDRNAIRVSWAEWYYLNSPDRLQSLAAKYLPLSKTKPSQVGSIEDIPMRQDDGRAVASAAYDLLKPGVADGAIASSGDGARHPIPNRLAALDRKLISTRRGPGP